MLVSDWMNITAHIQIIDRFRWISVDIGVYWCISVAIGIDICVETRMDNHKTTV